MVLSVLKKGLRAVFGTRNDRLVKGYRKRVELVNAQEPEVRKLTDSQLRARTKELQDMIKSGQRMAAILPQAMAVAREAMDRSVGIRNIFNPAHAFDPSRLPQRLQPVYAQVQQQMAATPPIEVIGCNELVPGWMQVEIPNEIYEAVRELYPTSRPPFRARPFDVQLIGGMVLSEGRIAEMKTGEGKTIVGPMGCYLACVENLKCYVVTVNDYLVQRDRDWVFPFYYWTGLSVGAIHPYHMQPQEKKAEAYHCNVVYGTNSEFGFDYLRDNMKMTLAEQVQTQRDFCIIDEVDSILIDEARTPLIISGPAHDAAPRYGLADELARHLMQKQRNWDACNVKVQQTLMRIKGYEGDIRNTRDKDAIPKMREEMKRLQEQLPQLEAERDKHPQYYEVERDRKAAHLTHQGVAEAQKVANIGSFYVGENMDVPHLLENALRAHVVYQRDKDYVVQNGEVIIVDEFTGRLMIGRQWSDGLHQAVEAKERVKIKEETQTLATVTIQNYFKLFKRLAGMTGTAVTEATEFNEIYRLEVVCIPTNVPVVRIDRDDLIFMSEKDKWNAIVEEIKRVHDVGRPVLVGTTSVERSEMLSALLQRKYGIKHEVLNAKQHEREAHIVEHAGQLGAVMIATNMAGRGTDIKLAAIDRAALIHHWQLRNIVPREASPDMKDEQILELAYRHLAVRELGKKPKDVEAWSLEQVKLELLRHWTAKEFQMEPDAAAKLSAQQCIAQLDTVPTMLLHKLAVYTRIEEMGGLHIVGTERHESRRIDNQLRGRAGRQGDRGSSRFFIALDDDLMKLFANKTTLNALSRLGMKEGDSLEHSWLTASVERAQRKVEERNYQIRKSLLEYDEVMEHQRNFFYGLRQDVLVGRQIETIVFDFIADAVQDAVDHFLDKDYTAAQIAEWCRQAFDVNIETFKLRDTDLDGLQRTVRVEATADLRQVVDVTLGEYLSPELPETEWDWKGLTQWMQSRLACDVPVSELRRKSIAEVKSLLQDAAVKLVKEKDLSGLARYFEPNFPQKQLAEWTKNKFSIEVDPQVLAKGDSQHAAKQIIDRARELYRKREIAYPIEFALEMTFATAQSDAPYAAEQLAAWLKQRYELEWKPEEMRTLSGSDLFQKIYSEAEKWWNGRLEQTVDEALRKHTDAAGLTRFVQERFGQSLEASELDGQQDRRELLLYKGRAMLRTELTQLERYVLLNILDSAWKDHLYAMDQLKDAVGLRYTAEKDPRIEYKREGAALFAQMQRVVRDRVTDLIFRARLTPQVQQTRSVYYEEEASHAAPQSALSTAPVAEDGEAAEAGDDGQPLSRKQRRAQAAQERKKK